MSELTRQVELLLAEVDSGQLLLKKQEELTQGAISQRDAALTSVRTHQQTAEMLRSQIDNIQRHHNR